MSDQDTTHFGFRTVAKDEKAKMVRGVFDSVASSYDIMNDLMSAGIHRLWKNQMVDWLNPQPGWNTIDVGGGTGDIAFRIQDRFTKRGGQGHITVTDINHEMLKVGRRRAVDAHRLEGLSWLCGNAEQLPVPDNSMDAYTIAFCIRNVTDIPAALRDAQRILKPGGRFMCLEFSQVVMPVLDKIYDLYSFKLLPEIGAVVAKDRDSYQYLAESIRKFPPQETFAQMIRDAGFDQVKYRNLTGGIAAIHSGWKI
ncbi:ubiquinone/menaquinone biosynthesis C-methyltransferase UbiE [Terasakiella brassicae]|uniref:Ubiquinone/menaquinone biosynthesis C-methyltransferase UbiE n=1 Tax=Terasakiella brassicae TaxID=1634917 RepID=A0A917FBT1_9PROT|nr:bifunctional demethylmenaquinone methyltransferase/2-methoxy-6-polyprenyl-1,4-benzoquinol methylase UbiE [Terasakiella brassicae]GGF66004.1 ubiquinone/menaquinone biosynthesis C-methyltransferase UbiE [Terasakiella brassicae]